MCICMCVYIYMYMQSLLISWTVSNTNSLLKTGEEKIIGVFLEYITYKCRPEFSNCAFVAHRL